MPTCFQGFFFTNPRWTSRTFWQLWGDSDSQSKKMSGQSRFFEGVQTTGVFRRWGKRCLFWHLLKPQTKPDKTLCQGRKDKAAVLCRCLWTTGCGVLWIWIPQKHQQKCCKALTTRFHSVCWEGHGRMATETLPSVSLGFVESTYRSPSFDYVSVSMGRNQVYTKHFRVVPSVGPSGSGSKGFPKTPRTPGLLVQKSHQKPMKTHQKAKRKGPDWPFRATLIQGPWRFWEK